ncbi:hypothetical protein Tco_0850573 [Tanacetum coccineum]
MLLDFDDSHDVSDDEVQDDEKGKAKADEEDLSKPFKEVLKCPFTRRIVEFSSPSHKMPTNIKIYDGTGDPEDHIGRFMGAGNQGEWPMPLAKRFSDSIPKTVDEMLKRVDDYLRPEEAYRNTELPRGEFQRRDAPVQWVERNDQNQRLSSGNNRCGSEHRLTTKMPDRHTPYVAPQRPNQDFHRPKVVLTLSSLSSTPQEILATEHQLNLPQPAPLVGVPSKENLNRYCDYHNEKGHITNDCFHLKLEIALESGKLNHLIKDVRQRGKGGQLGNSPQKAKIINMVQSQSSSRKRKTTMTDE